MKIKINDKTNIDLFKLIESRLLVQANSGGGKSWAIRRLIEQSFGHVQIIVLDPEGEFTNLRQKYDFVFCGKEGDAPVESRSATLLARRLLELKASAIVDLYELAPQERKHFVKLFCESLVNAPKELWHDALVIIDEAHVFAPEKGESEALGAVIDLASRGRKRGYCAVLATQRPAKLNKDAAAECNNKLIGRASLDIDRKRAAEELGFTSREQVISLRDLDPGEFYVFGPAISRDVQKITIGDVHVKPPKRGERKNVPPPPTDKVKKILSQLADIPKEVENEENNVIALEAKIKELGNQIRNHKCQSGYSPEELRKEAERLVAKAKIELEKSFDDEIRRARKSLTGMRGPIEKIQSMSGELLKVIAGIEGEKVKANIAVPTIRLPIPPKQIMTPVSSRPVNATLNDGLTKPEQRILDAIMWLESINVLEPEQTAVAFLAGYTYGSGGFNNPKGSLRSKGLIEYLAGNKVKLTDEGRNSANAPTDALGNDELHAKVLSVLDTPQQRILKPLLERYPEAISNQELAELSGYTAGSGGFNNPKGRLRSLGLIEYLSGGMVRARDILFPN